MRVGNRTTAWARIALAFVAAGCGAAAPELRGITAARYAGATPVVFTNASPAHMCGLYLSADDEPDHGDNWLAAAGLPSGASLELSVRPGTYKARWDTCRGTGTAPGAHFYAATLWRDTAVTLDEQPTQLYAYIADRVPPTQRAPVLGGSHKLVRFPGQPIAMVGARPRGRELARASSPRMSRPVADVSAQREAIAEPTPIAGFVGWMPLDAEWVALRAASRPRFDASEFVESSSPRPARRRGDRAPAPTPQAAGSRPGALRGPAGSAVRAEPADLAVPELKRRYEISERRVRYQRR
jgi:hypothetical protein